jgi:hypothetical protein
MAEANSLEAQLDGLLVTAAANMPVDSKALGSKEDRQDMLQQFVAAKAVSCTHTTTMMDIAIFSYCCALQVARANALQAQEAGDLTAVGVHTAEANMIEAELDGLLAQAGVASKGADSSDEAARLLRLNAEEPVAKLERLVAEKAVRIVTFVCQSLRTLTELPSIAGSTGAGAPSWGTARRKGVGSACGARAVHRGQARPSYGTGSN